MLLFDHVFRVGRAECEEAEHIFQSEIGLQKRLHLAVIVHQFTAEAEKEHHIPHTVDIVDQLADAFVGILPAQLGIADGIAGDAVQQGFHIVDHDEQALVTRQTHDFT